MIGRNAMKNRQKEFMKNLKKNMPKIYGNDEEDKTGTMENQEDLELQKELERMLEELFGMDDE